MTELNFRETQQGLLARSLFERVLPLEVCEGQGGYYLGTMEPVTGGKKRRGKPFTRESEEIFATRTEAEEALAADWAWTQRRPYGLLAQWFGYKQLQLEICQSAAGYYLGTREEVPDDASSHLEPFTRESVEYWPNRRQAEEALRGLRPWEQRPQP